MIFIVMGNILITEKQLEELVKTIKETPEEELEEGFLGDLGRDIGTLRFGNIFAGLKGTFSGKGYSLNRNMNIIKNSLRKLKNSERTMLSVMKELKHVEVEFSELETNNEVASNIISNLRSLISNYEGYKHASRNLQNIVTTYYETEDKGKGKGKSSGSEKLVNPTPKTYNTGLSSASTPLIGGTSSNTQPSVTQTTTANSPDKITEKENFFRDWISGEYKLANDNMIYYLTITKKWEVRKSGGTFDPLKTTLSKDNYEKKLEELKNSNKV